jgi:anti-sigma factor RsiW
MQTMTCRQLTDRLLDYCCGEIDPAGRRAIEEHLIRCDRCLRYLRDYALTVRLLRSTAARGAERPWQ